MTEKQHGNLSTGAKLRGLNVGDTITVEPSAYSKMCNARAYFQSKTDRRFKSRRVKRDGAVLYYVFERIR